MKALIIGGGIGGLTAAIALRRAGIEATVFEHSDNLRESGTGLTLWCNATRILQALGLGDRLKSVSSPLAHGEIRDATGRLLAGIPLEQLSREFQAPVLGIHRADLVGLLAAQAGANAICAGYRFDSFAQDADRVTAKFANGRCVEGDFLVGADGIHSTVRSQVLGDPQHYCGYIAWRGVADFRPNELHDGQTVLYCGRGAQFGFVPLGNQQTYWFATANVSEHEIGRLGPPREELAKKFADWHAPIAQFLSVMDDAAVLCAPIYDRPPEWIWGRGRVTLLGDAAHATSPTLGQGACLAIESAYALARYLTRAKHVVPGLRAFEYQQQVRTARIIRHSSRLGSALQWSRPWACKFRDWIIRRTPAAWHMASLRRVIQPGCMPLDLSQKKG